MSVQSVLSHILKLHKVWKVLGSENKCAQVFYYMLFIFFCIFEYFILSLMWGNLFLSFNIYTLFVKYKTKQKDKGNKCI